MKRAVEDRPRGADTDRTFLPDPAGGIMLSLIAGLVPRGSALDQVFDRIERTS
ncbi:hypothetical protein [Frigidibacter oleivorans]|uniref:hypothetical protein n=1 Tax=Frigidibacter oleivorans TaxID=2487129 RepID=UPI0013DEF3B4|nr:hypothetical protein [Frigidibacter oleivorans]